MPAYTLEQAQAQLDAWLKASLAAATNKSYEIAGRRLTRQDAAEIQRQVEYWSREVQLLRLAGAGRSRARTMRVL
jgi:hypothetical protein